MKMTIEIEVVEAQSLNIYKIKERVMYEIRKELGWIFADGLISEIKKVSIT